MTEPCPFCKSKTRILETPFIDRVTGEHETTYCCLAQKKNHSFVKKRYNPIDNQMPDMEKMEKL